MLRIIVFILALMPIPAMANPAADSLRELVLAGDVAAVEAAVVAAVAKDAASATEPDLQSMLFTVFSAPPDIGAFTARWLQERPKSALAMTAQGWQDYARVMDAVDGFGSPEMRVEMLEGLKAERTLGPSEASALDMARNHLQAVPSLIEPVEYKAALPGQGLSASCRPGSL